ncbi:MAG: glycoside hydrolase family 127 protein [Prevotellaceae bacterium]|jgi:hypothetical protein|nr:glycoside hydrolase family 127 protein [Prevotellaceae bacterium]
MASWGVDFIKIDDLSRPYHKREIEMIRKAIDRCGRPIVLSMSPGKTPVGEALHASTHANMWRMVDDVWDKWEDVTHLMQVAQDWYPYIGPTWPACDMIPLGRISIRGERGVDRMTRLTKDEQYSLMTFFTIFRSPPMFGGDLPGNDEFTLSLLTNREVLRMHRESAGVRQLFQQGGKVAIMSRNSVTEEIYLAVFNISDHPEPMEIPVGNEIVVIEQHTGYPWNGKVNIRITTKNPLAFALKIRIPSWAQNTSASGGLYVYSDNINIQPSQTPNTADGYYTVTRHWRSGDSLTLDFPMQVRTVEANANVKDDAGKFAVECGPLVYCMEETDNPGTFDKPSHAPSFSVEWKPGLLGSVNVVHEQSDDSGKVLIPYYAWSNRDVGKMKVWRIQHKIKH